MHVCMHVYYTPSALDPLLAALAHFNTDEDLSARLATLFTVQRERERERDGERDGGRAEGETDTYTHGD